MLTTLAKARWAGDAAALESSYVQEKGLLMAEKGARAQVIGASRGGQTIMLHALTDVLGGLASCCRRQATLAT